MKLGNDEPTTPPTISQRLSVGVMVVLLLIACVVPSGAYASEADAHAAIADAFPSWAVPSFVRIARCESGFDPGARSHGWDRVWGRYDYRGILQVEIALHQWRAERRFGPGASLYDPRVNAHVAAEVFAEQGWGAWPYCSRVS